MLRLSLPLHQPISPADSVSPRPPIAMGQMRFHAPQPERVPKEAVHRAYLAGLEGIPWFSHNTWQNGQLILERDITESGALHIPWNVANHGQFVLSTASLMERARPYHLPVELARGTLNRLRNQAANWQGAGLQISPEAEQLIRKAVRSFVRAATQQAEPVSAALAAEEALTFGMDAIERLCDDYSCKVLELRHRQAPRFPTLMAANLGSCELTNEQAAPVLAACNAAVTPLVWQAIEFNEGEHDWAAVDAAMEWCRQRQLRIASGPLLHLDPGHLPDWLYLWVDDFENIQSYCLSFIEQAVQRYRGRVSLWHAAAGMNCGNELGLSEEQKLRLTVSALETLRRHDSRTPLIVSFDQPWAEYLAIQNYDLSPMHFADALVRAELGVAGIGLEINLGYYPGGELYRDLLEFSRLIDQWSVSLGLPLVLILTAPSDAIEDVAARKQVDPLLVGAVNAPTARRQKEFIERLTPFLLAKTSVQGIIWNQLSDDEPHKFAHGGLMRQGQPKPALLSLGAIRGAHLT